MSTAIDQNVKEAEKRLEPARKDKDKHRSRLDDYYQYALPWRHQIDQEYTDDDVDNIFDSTAMDAVADFAADMLATFTPIEFEWIEPVPSKVELTKKDRQVLQPQIEAFNEAVFAEIRRSNFSAEALECYQDLTHGTMAINITDIHISKPVFCESISANDLLIYRGPFKDIGVRGYDMMYAADQIPALWPKAKEDRDLMKIVNDSPAKMLKVTQVAWRDYSDIGTEKWFFRAYADKKFLLEDAKFTGQGSCPITVARWMTDNTTTWGIGPGYLKLPDIKTANTLVELLLEKLEEAVDPMWSFEDDGVMNLENDLQPGMWIPRAPGSEVPQPLESRTNFDVSYFDRDGLRENILRGFYQDKPLQRGKTPPTATQFLEEAADAARRLGAPAGRLVYEWQFGIYNRFAYILQRRGKLPQVELNGEFISLEANSPLIRAQRQAEALQMQQFVSVLTSIVGPEMAQASIDPVEAAYALKALFGIKAEILTNREELEALVGQMKAMMAQATQQAMGPQNA